MLTFFSDQTHIINIDSLFNEKINKRSSDFSLNIIRNLNKINFNLIYLIRLIRKINLFAYESKIYFPELFIRSWSEDNKILSKYLNLNLNSYGYL